MTGAIIVLAIAAVLFLATTVWLVLEVEDLKLENRKLQMTANHYERLNKTLQSVPSMDEL